MPIYYSTCMYGGSFRQEQRRPLDKQEPSRVLLVCIYDTIALEVGNQLVYEKFSRYGPIIKVLILSPRSSSSRKARSPNSSSSTPTNTVPRKYLYLHSGQNRTRWY